MSHRRFDWHEELKSVQREYHSTLLAVDYYYLSMQLSDLKLINHNQVRSGLKSARENLEGTYLVRLFACFESCLRSYDQSRQQDQIKKEVVAILIDSVAGRRGQGISASVRANAHAVRQVRNRWAHDDDSSFNEMSFDIASKHLHLFLSWLPEYW